MRSKLSRRDFLNFIKAIGGGVLATYAGHYYVSNFEPSWVDVTQVTLPLANLPQAFIGFRIAQVSDVHIGGWMNKDRLAHIVEKVIEQKPNLVVITGDFMIGHFWDFVLDQAAEDFFNVVTPLTQKFPVLAVLGNHDHWTDSERTRSMLERTGVIELKNDIRRLDHNGESLYIAGVDDVFVGMDRLEEVEAKLPEGAPTILLAHEPDYADITSATGKFLLQLSGHSHGGQVNLPFYGPLVLPNFARRYPIGLYQIAQMYLYTNRGVGMTEPFVRFNCRPEITVFTLNQG